MLVLGLAVLLCLVGLVLRVRKARAKAQMWAAAHTPPACPGSAAQAGGGTAEAEPVVRLSQASSIQNLGVTCESLTIGHNPFKLPLSRWGLTLPGQRPLFLCEKEFELRERAEKARAERQALAQAEERKWEANPRASRCCHLDAASIP